MCVPWFPGLCVRPGSSSSAERSEDSSAAWVLCCMEHSGAHLSFTPVRWPGEGFPGAPKVQASLKTSVNIFSQPMDEE